MHNRVPVKRLKDALEGERVALLQGDYAALEALNAQKITYVGEIDWGELAPDVRADLARSLRETYRLSGFALKEVQLALEALRARQSASEHLQTYDAHGGARTIRSTRSRKIHRA